MAVNDNYISYTGFEVDHVTAIDLEINKYAKDSVKFWDQFFKAYEYKKGYKTFEHRKHIRPETTIKYANSLKLSEGVGTPNENLKIVKWSDTFDDYGSHYDYTKEALRDNYDDVLDLAKDQFETEAVEVPELLKADVICTSNFQMTAESTICDTLDKAAVILTKKKSKPFKGTKYLCIMTPETMKKFTSELKAQGVALPEATKSEIITEGSVKEYGRFYIVENPDEPMYDNSDTSNPKDKLVFICRTRDNELPGAKMDPEISVFDNGLGSNLIQKSATDTTLVADTNKRVGSLAMNIDHLGIAIQADLGHLVCTIDHVDYAASATPTADPINGVTATGVVPTTETVTRK
jgi:hypothetical protein